MRKKILVTCLLTLSCLSQTDQETPYDEVAFNWSRTLAEVAQKVGQNHFKLPEKSHTCWEEAINAYVSCLDPHSGFLAPKAYAQITQTTAGSFGGIGVVIDNTRQTKDNVLTVIDVIPNGPADQAGVLPLDKIVEIDNQIITGMATEEIIAKLKGKPGSTVELKLLREKFPDLIVVNVTRSLIDEQSSLSFYLPDQQVYYVSLNTFSQNSTKQIEQLLKKAKDHPYKGLILDLRNNSGGLLTSAIDIVGLFLPNGSMVVETKGRDNKKTQEYRTKREPIINNKLPILILTNNYTASAGEILAGCLQLHAKASNELMVFLVGSCTFGKGSVQEIVPVSNNSALKLTVALYYLPGDVSIQGTGIEPDFLVERMLPQTEQMKWFTKSHGRECSIENHIATEKSKALKEKEKKEQDEDTGQSKHKKWADRMKDALQKDNQFKSALSLINIFNLVSRISPDSLKTRDQALDILKSAFAGDQPLSFQEVKAN